MARPRKHKFQLSSEEKAILVKVSNASSEQTRHVQRAKILLLLSEGLSNKAVASRMGISPLTVGKVLSKYHSVGIEGALEDYQRTGRPLSIGAEAKVWVTSLACTLPKDLPDGPSIALWSLNSLTQYVRQQCEFKGFPCLKNVSKSQIWNFLQQNELKPQKIKYYLEKKDPNFDQKAKKVLLVYKRIEWILQFLGKDSAFHVDSAESDLNEVYISYDEKPGIQAISNIAPDLAPNNKSGFVRRDYEYRRLGTVSLLAGINLIDGKVIGIVRDRHSSEEFIEFLKKVDQSYEQQATIHIILDNHSVHRSKKVFDYLATRPGRFKFTFTPKHASWLNLIESFFSKLSRMSLRGLRVKSKQELVDHIEKFLQQVNQVPVIYHWKWKLEDIEQAFVA